MRKWNTDDNFVAIDYMFVAIHTSLTSAKTFSQKSNWIYGRFPSLILIEMFSACFFATTGRDISWFLKHLGNFPWWHVFQWVELVWVGLNNVKQCNYVCKVSKKGRNLIKLWCLEQHYHDWLIFIVWNISQFWSINIRSGGILREGWTL